MNKKENKIRLKRAEITQLLLYAKEREYDGWYYGNKKQFEKRHKKIIDYLRICLGEK